MKENIIENIFYRFNPYFPDRKLPFYDINPANPQDYNVKLGLYTQKTACVRVCTEVAYLIASRLPSLFVTKYRV